MVNPVQNFGARLREHAGFGRLCMTYSVRPIASFAVCEFGNVL